MWIQLSITYIILITSPNLGVKVNSTSEFVYNTLFLSWTAFVFYSVLNTRKLLVFLIFDIFGISIIFHHFIVLGTF